MRQKITTTAKAKRETNTHQYVEQQIEQRIFPTIIISRSN
jgi:hypothetical protein